MNWLHEQFLRAGFRAIEARFHPDYGVWFLYDDEGALIGVFEHELVERITAVLDSCEQHQIDAKIDAIMNKDKRGW